MAIEVVNPATNEVIHTYDEMTWEQIESILNKAQKTFEQWKETPFAQRSKKMKTASKLLNDKKEQYARLMADEMGKPLAQGRAEVEKCTWCCDFYADNAEKFLSPEMVETDASRSYVTFNPLGVVLAVMPWNFPFWQVFRFAAPGLMAGNAGILKHASNVPGCALAIEEIFRNAEFPENLFRTVLVNNQVVARIIEHQHVKAVTLTGSTPAGQSVASKAGSVLKKTVLELGGSDPYIILKDADLESAVNTCVLSRLINGGQSCIAAKRFIVVNEVRQSFEDMFVEKMKSKKMGNPLENVDLGPQARMDLRNALHRQVVISIEKGARLLLGGQIPELDGAYYPPTVLTDVKKGMPAYDDELFGPVAAIIPVEDEEEAIRVANDSVFGLGAAVFTRDIKRGENIAAEKLEAGACFVNAFVKSDPRLPFGGIKESGYGRELSVYGIREFVNIKTVFIK
ncbi:MAG TPA: NAD-dependent succinate-semialdehyde dehydrogenase [Acidobacteriota bacterium]|nr:NAD-dependent succinate-semialdehyde dehydrogenase [Acidobacteriota bacterium]